MRMSRWEWLARFFRPTPRVRERKQGTGRPKDAYQIAGKRFSAYTRSEARAMAKKALGYKDRLPAGMMITKLPPD